MKKPEIMLDDIFDSAEVESEENIDQIKFVNQYRQIPIEKIHSHHKNRQLQKDKIEQLVNSILNIGMLDAPIVTQDCQDTFTIISGHHRIAACRQLVENGYPEYNLIKCKILNADDLDNELQLIDANIVNAPLSSYEMMVAIGRKEELLKQKKKQGVLVGNLKLRIADEGNLKSTQVGTYLKVYKDASDRVKNELKNGSITLSKAYVLSKLDESTQNLKLQKKAVCKKPEDNIFKEKIRLSLIEKFQTTVNIQPHCIKISYSDDNDLNRILEVIDCLENLL